MLLLQRMFASAGVHTRTHVLPSKLRFMLVKGRRESRISRTTSVRASKDGSIRTNLDMCPGNHEGGTGRGGIWRRAGAIFKVAGE